MSRAPYGGASEEHGGRGPRHGSTPYGRPRTPETGAAVPAQSHGGFDHATAPRGYAPYDPSAHPPPPQHYRAASSDAGASHFRGQSTVSDFYALESPRGSPRGSSPNYNEPGVHAGDQSIAAPYARIGGQSAQMQRPRGAPDVIRPSPTSLQAYSVNEPSSELLAGRPAGLSSSLPGGAQSSVQGGMLQAGPPDLTGPVADATAEPSNLPSPIPAPVRNAQPGYEPRPAVELHFSSDGRPATNPYRYEGLQKRLADYAAGARSSYNSYGPSTRDSASTGNSSSAPNTYSPFLPEISEFSLASADPGSRMASPFPPGTSGNTLGASFGPNPRPQPGHSFGYNNFAPGSNNPPGAYPGGYAAAYSGGYTGPYPGSYPGYTGTYTGNYSGGYPGGYPGTNPANLGGYGNYPGVYSYGGYAPPGADEPLPWQYQQQNSGAIRRYPPTGSEGLERAKRQARGPRPPDEPFVDGSVPPHPQPTGFPPHRTFEPNYPPGPVGGHGPVTYPHPAGPPTRQIGGITGRSHPPETDETRMLVPGPYYEEPVETQWLKDDVEELMRLLEVSERAKWKYVSDLLLEKEDVRASPQACLRRFKELFGSLEAESELRSSLFYIAYRSGWLAISAELTEDERQDGMRLAYSQEEFETTPEVEDEQDGTSQVPPEADSAFADVSGAVRGIPGEPIDTPNRPSGVGYSGTNATFGVQVGQTSGGPHVGLAGGPGGLSAGSEEQLKKEFMNT